MTTLHPARTIPFRELVDALRSAREARLVSEQASPDGLRVICYTPSCVYDGQWNDVTLIARGLVLDVKNERVVATPFPKFFNAFERGETIPDLPFETFEKVDGSLIIIFWHAGEWKTTTKAAFGSTQAQWAAERLKSCDTPNANAAVLKPILPSEVRETVQLYLAGKLDQWFVKQDHLSGAYRAAKILQPAYFVWGKSD